MRTQGDRKRSDEAFKVTDMTEAFDWEGIFGDDVCEEATVNGLLPWDDMPLEDGSMPYDRLSQSGWLDDDNGYCEPYDEEEDG